MGILKKWKHRKEKRQEKYKEDKEPLKEEAEKAETPVQNKSATVKEDGMESLRQNCEQIIEALKQVEEAKIEYQAVTSYLTDMQKIDNIPKEERKDLEEDARQIIMLSRERDKYQKKKQTKITETQYKNIERYETEIVNEIKKISANESYLSMVKNDMRHLEGEKGALIYEKEETVKQQKYLKNMSVIICIFVVFLFLLFFIIAYTLDKDMTIPYLLTVLLGAFGGGYIFLEARKNLYTLKLNDKKMNKAINMLNKVKIKYVNNKNMLDYEYEKYSVKNSMELQYLWEQYLKVKEERKKYQDNTDLLNFYNESLIKELRRFQIADPEIWIFQSQAIIDSKEMVEIRHRLNTRRQKLRERIDYNSGLKEKAVNEMKQIVKEKEELRGEVTQLLEKYHILMEE